jgi:3-hydroxyisobutyrate dehydrogenase
MGLPMAINLIRQHHQVTGFDLQAENINLLVEAGGIPGTSLNKTAANQDILITMLQTGDQVQAVCLTPDGLFANAHHNTLYIDCSSIDVNSARHIHEAAQIHGLRCLDAPVSGGVNGAKAATLTFMAGGTNDTLHAAMPILNAMGKTVIHTGDAGSGQAAKICNNMILGISMIAVSEAFILAEQLGLRADKLFEVVNHASGQCWVMSQYVPVPDILEHVPANHDYQAGFTAAMMLKDLLLSQQSASTAHIKTPMAAYATQLYEQLTQHDMGHLDFSAIIQLIRQQGCQ